MPTAENVKTAARGQRPRRRRRRMPVLIFIMLLLAAVIVFHALQPIEDDGLPRSKGRWKDSKKVEAWKPGLLDIHHIQAGSSVSTYVVMPDGTTMLIDAGDVNVKATKSQWSTMGPPLDSLDIKPPYPNSKQTPVGWIIKYMEEFWPNKLALRKSLDYLLLTHFHSDHFGDGTPLQSDRKMSPSGGYLLSGIPELESKINIKRIIDRGYPNYDVPVDLRSLKDTSIDNYLQFVKEKENAISFQQFQVGSTHQITMQKDPKAYDFQIRVIKSGLHVAAPYDPNLPKDASVPVEKIPGDVLSENWHGNENTMSAAIGKECRSGISDPMASSLCAHIYLFLSILLSLL